MGSHNFNDFHNSNNRHKNTNSYNYANRNSQYEHSTTDSYKYTRNQVPRSFTAGRKQAKAAVRLPRGEEGREGPTHEQRYSMIPEETTTTARWKSWTSQRRTHTGTSLSTYSPSCSSPTPPPPSPPLVTSTSTSTPTTSTPTSTQASQSPAEATAICLHFIAGSCRFGKRCWFKHIDLGGLKPEPERRPSTRAEEAPSSAACVPPYPTSLSPVEAWLGSYKKDDPHNNRNNHDDNHNSSSNNKNIDNIRNSSTNKIPKPNSSCAGSWPTLLTSVPAAPAPCRRAPPPPPPLPAAAAAAAGAPRGVRLVRAEAPRYIWPQPRWYDLVDDPWEDYSIEEL